MDNLHVLLILIVLFLLAVFTAVYYSNFLVPEYNDSFEEEIHEQNNLEKCKKENSIVIVFDEMVNYKYLPDHIVSKLRGYQAFKKIGIEFTNIHNNRQDCSPSRSTMLTSHMNHGIGDDIQEEYQYNYYPYVNEDLDTLGKIYKRNNYDLTAYYGKSHIDARLTKEYQFLPVFSLNTRGAMKTYGFDIFNTFGDTSLNLGIMGDNREFQSTVPPSYTEFDYLENDMKLTGIIPFLKARARDGKSFHAQYHMVNPHDTMQLYQNTSQIPKITMGQFLYPYLEEQSSETGYKNPFIYSSAFQDAWIKDSNLVSNFFEKSYSEYCTNFDSLPFKTEYLRDYVSSTDNKIIIPCFAGTSLSLGIEFSIANSKEDIKSWKNLVNNYYGLVMQTDDYLYRIYKFLEENDMLRNTSVVITADHGDQISSHGLKQKGYPFKESENIPLIVYSPNIEDSWIGKTCDVLACHLDLNPTVEVLSNLENKSKLFSGRSLLQTCNGKLKPILKDESVIHVCISTMHLEGAYLGYLKWKAQNKDKDYKILFEPKNLYDMQYSFIMLIDKINGKQYKFCRFSSYSQLLSTNLKNVKINKQDMLDYKNERYPESEDEYMNDIKQLLPNEFSFDDGLSLVYSEYGTSDSKHLSLFFFLVSLYLDKLNKGLILLCGLSNKYEELKNQNMFLCWNTTDDVEEIHNLCEVDTPNNNKLFENLNLKLNLEILNQGGDNFLYAIPFDFLKNVYDKIDTLKANISKIQGQQLNRRLI